MTKNALSKSYVSLLRGMLSATWQKPSEGELVSLLREVDHDTEKNSTPLTTASDNQLRKRLTALVAAGTKLDAAAQLVKEATVDLAIAVILPKDPTLKILADIDAVIKRIKSTIELIP